MVNSIINKIGKLVRLDNTFANWFIFIGLIIQCLVFRLNNETVLSLISGLSGVISVVLCSQKKSSFYFWGILQLITILIISVNSGLYGKVIENVFYLLTLFLGLNEWKKNDSNGVVKVRQMDVVDYVIFGTIIIPICSIFSYLIVIKYNSCQIGLDTITTVIGMVAQILMILRFKEQWVLWFVLDILCIILWAKVGNWCLMVQYIFWAINCIYGSYCWYYEKN